ncbi:hypothetical protein [Kitasatospora sp. NPDC088548]|uniref:hypothetical protein n=1 Tax=Kitasatospora sp. NPDC088548 TaxID=3364075 RepID=UPI0037F6C761
MPKTGTNNGRQESGPGPIAPAQRTAAGAAAPASPASRIPAPARERRPGVAAFAVLVIAGCALGSAYLYQQAGQKVSAVEITTRVAPGQHIPPDAITEVLISKDSGLKYVPWEQRALLTSKYFTASDVPAGTLLVGSMLTDSTGVAGDQAIVGLSLKPGQYPQDLKEGDRVRVMWVGRDAKAPASGSTPASGAPAGTAGAVELAPSGTVRQIFHPANGSVSSTYSLSIVVPAAKAGDITQASSSGDVALVLLPASGQ